MFSELVQTCGNTVPLIDVTSNGSIDNMNKLIGNEVNAGIVQMDVLWLRAQTQDLGNIKTLFTLFPEEVHVVAKSGGKKEGGVMGFGAKEVVLNTVSDLRNKNVGAAGGSAVTAQVIRLQGEIPFQLMEFSSTDQVLAALREDKIDAAILVGGQPLGAVANLDRSYKLLEFPDQVVNRLAKVYTKTAVSYPKMGASGMVTVSTEAIFVTRDYKTQKYVKSLLDLRSCLFKNIDELKETTGMHPKWGAVNPANKGKWVWYEAPGK